MVGGGVRRAACESWVSLNGKCQLSSARSVRGVSFVRSFPLIAGPACSLAVVVGLVLGATRVVFVVEMFSVAVAAWASDLALMVVASEDSISSCLVVAGSGADS